MPDKPSELKPCPTPWCTGEATGNPPQCHECSSGWYVMCDECGVVTPYYFEKADAASIWNESRTPDRTALIAVCTRGLNYMVGQHQSVTAEAERIVTEYLAEQAGKDSE